MRFKSLSIENFRGIRELGIDFDPSLTVIVGRNGTGKTSILDALGELARLCVSRLKLGRRIGWFQELSSRDVRLGASSFALGLTVDFEVERSDSQRNGSLRIAYNADRNSLDSLLPNDLAAWSDEIRTQPQFIYYRQDRGFESRRDGPSGEHRTLDPEALQRSSLDRDMRAIGDLEAWWDRRDAQEARIVRDDDPDYRDPQLEAIRKLVTKIDGFSGIAYSATASPPGLRFLKRDDAAIHVSGLSGGERSYIILLADLARRLQAIAPDRPLEDIPAIVMIDEIELNLHPAWQSEIAPTLTRVFAACQFIVATHSPQVVSGVHSANVRILDQAPSGETSVSIPLSTRGRTSNYLLDGVFRAWERYPPIDLLVDEFNAAVDRGDAATAEARLAGIEAEIEGDAPTVLVLRKRLRKLRDGT